MAAADEENDCPKCEAGAAWLATFADLMSLLMCFFVLLLSFSEMDVQKYKRVAGSMKSAFGVQREINAKQIPKGTSIVAQNYSPGKPQPTAVPQMRQMTTNEMKNNLDFSDTREKNNKAKAADRGKGSSEDRGKGMGKEEGQLPNTVASETDAANANKGASAEGEESAKPSMAQSGGLTEEERMALAQAKLRRVRELLDKEINAGKLQVEVLDGQVVVSIRENGIFGSGASSIRPEFLPVLLKLSSVANQMAQKTIVGGHSDNRPIRSASYPSNWELSAARAASVVRFMTTRGRMASADAEVRAYGDSQPVADNETVLGRAQNRRVEVILYEDYDAPTEEFVPSALPNAASNTAGEAAIAPLAPATSARGGAATLSASQTVRPRQSPGEVPAPPLPSFGSEALPEG